MTKQIVIDRVYIDEETRTEDELLLIKKINFLLSKISPKWERVSIVILDEEIQQDAGGRDD